MVFRNAVTLFTWTSLVSFTYIFTFTGFVAGQTTPSPNQEADESAHYLITIRGNEEATKQLAAMLGHNYLEPETFEFPNGNTFVRFRANLTGKHITVLLPAEFTADTLMEALIKVYYASHQRASSVDVRTPNESNEVVLLNPETGEKLRLDLAQLMAVAGARRIQFGNRPLVRLKTNLPIVKDLNGQIADAWVYAKHHKELGSELAVELKLPILAHLDALAAFQNTMVFYLLPSSEPANWNFFRALYDISQLHKKGVLVSLISPYLPYARTDKIDQDGVTITGKLIADLIQAVGTDSITFVRAHAPQSEGFFSIPTFHVHGRETINEHILSLGIDIVISPDNGASKETYQHAKELGLPMAVLDKARDPITGKLLIKGISSEIPIEGKRVALIDDETLTGGTSAEGAEYLKQRMGAEKVFSIVTALAGDAGKAVNSPHLDGFTVTDSIPVPGDMKAKVTVLSVAKEIARKLRPLRALIHLNPDCQSSFE